MGDIGKGLYVSHLVPPIYTSLLPLASIITPNAFELSLLSLPPTTDYSTASPDASIDTLQELKKALVGVHAKGVKHVAVSSVVLRRREVKRLGLPPPPRRYMELIRQGGGEGVKLHSDGDDEDEELLLCFASSSSAPSQPNGSARAAAAAADDDADGGLESYAFALPTVQGYYSGVGDLFSALVLGFYNPSSLGTQTKRIPNGQPHVGDADVDAELPPFRRAVGKALAAVQQVLLKSHIHTISRAHVNGSAIATTTAHVPSSVEDDCIPTDDDLDSVLSKTGRPTRMARRSRKRELRLIAEMQGVLADVKDGQGWPGKKVVW
jgi:pyridoxine kinase